MNSKKILISILILCIMILSAFSAAGFQFSPISHTFEASGQNTNKTFRATNDTNNPIAVQIEVHHRELDIEGNETLKDASDLFTVYPKQSVIQPGNYQTVYVRWNGPARVESEQEFRIVARQQPVDFSDNSEGANINILFVYKGTIYVQPDTPTYNIEIDSIEPAVRDGEDFIRLVLKNTGNSHIFLENPVLKIIPEKAGTPSVTLNPDQLEMLEGENFFGGQKRRFFVPWPEGLEQGDIDAELSSDYIR